MSEKLYLYPKWLRLWHWLNALIFLVLIVTGLSMQYSNPDYPLIRFDIAVSVHNICGVTLSGLYIFFLLRNARSGNRMHYRLPKEGLMDQLTQQVKYYTGGIFKNEAPPYPVTAKQKFNPLQKFTYVMAQYVGMPFIIITGWALLYPEITLDRIFGTSGLILTHQLHIILGFLLSIFMCIHIYFATISHSPGGNFKAMMTGYHE